MWYGTQRDVTFEQSMDGSLTTAPHCSPWGGCAFDEGEVVGLNRAKSLKRRTTRS
jgi:hypothetical protein